MPHGAWGRGGGCQLLEISDFRVNLFRFELIQLSAQVDIPKGFVLQPHRSYRDRKLFHPKS